MVKPQVKVLKSGTVVVTPFSRTREAIDVRKKASVRYQNLVKHGQYDSAHKEVDKMKLEELFKPYKYRNRHQAPKWKDYRVKNAKSVPREYEIQKTDVVQRFPSELQYLKWKKRRNEIKAQKQAEIKAKKISEERLKAFRERNAQELKRRNEQAAQNPPSITTAPAAAQKAGYELRTAKYKGKVVRAMVPVLDANGKPLSKKQIQANVINTQRSSSVVADLFKQVNKAR